MGLISRGCPPTTHGCHGKFAEPSTHEPLMAFSSWAMLARCLQDAYERGMPVNPLNVGSAANPHWIIACLRQKKRTMPSCDVGMRQTWASRWLVASACANCKIRPFLDCTVHPVLCRLHLCMCKWGPFEMVGFLLASGRPKRSQSSPLLLALADKTHVLRALHHVCLVV